LEKFKAMENVKINRHVFKIIVSYIVFNEINRHVFKIIVSYIVFNENFPA